jgi:hypothetical protein
VKAGTSRGDLEHTFFMSLVDQNDILPTQCLGVQFNPDEMFRDLQSLIREAKGR